MESFKCFSKKFNYWPQNILHVIHIGLFGLLCKKNNIE